MLVTTAPAAPTTEPRTATTSLRPIWRTGARAGLVAALATTAVAAGARVLDVPVEAGGEAIPLVGFAQMTLLCTAIGVVLAKVLAGRARTPRTTFVRATVALTALSLVPDVVLDTDMATRAVLVLTHLVAAAVVIPALAGRLGDR